MKNGSGGRGYIGRISNTGAQKVEAPYRQGGKRNGILRTGEDLRTGRGQGRRGRAREGRN